MKITLEKQPQKNLRSVPSSTRDKIMDAIEGILQRKGDIRKLSGSDNLYRL